MDLARLRESISHITFYLINVAHDDHESIRKARNDVYDTDTCRLRVLKSNFDGREKRLNGIIRKAYSEWLIKKVRAETKCTVKFLMSDDDIDDLLRVKSHDAQEGRVTRSIDLIDEETKETRKYEWTLHRVGNSLIPSSHKLVHKKTYNRMKEVTNIMTGFDTTMRRKQYRGNSLSNRLFAAARIGE